MVSVLVGDKNSSNLPEAFGLVFFKRKIARVDKNFLTLFLDQKVGLWVFGNFHPLCSPTSLKFRGAPFLLLASLWLATPKLEERRVVDLRRFELLTFAMRMLRSTR